MGNQVWMIGLLKCPLAIVPGLGSGWFESEYALTQRGGVWQKKARPEGRAFSSGRLDLGCKLGRVWSSRALCALR